MFVRTCRVALMIGLTAAFVMAWLPLVRSLLDGPSYEWGLTLFGKQFSGAGLSGDYWFISLEATLGVVLLFLGWRSPGALFKILSLFFTGAMFADTLYSAFVLGRGQTFEGATLGVAVSVGTIFMAVYGLMFALALVWAAFGQPGRPARWSIANGALLTIALLLLPLQYLLLSTGEGREISDQFGVLITMGQWLLVSLSFVPWTRGPTQRLSPA